MAARKTLWTPDVVRARIQTGVLTQRLQDHVLGKVELSPTQIRAADILLKKAIPDLQSTELTGPGGSALAVTLKQYTPKA